MGIALNHPSLRSVGWYPPVDANWTTLESFYVARQKSDTSVVTVSGTTAETALMSSATIPANTFQPGVVLDPWAFGNVTIPASSTPSVTFRLRWGGLAGTLLATYTWNFASQASAYQQGWNADSRLVCVTSGVTGTMDAAPNDRESRIGMAKTRGPVSGPSPGPVPGGPPSPPAKALFLPDVPAPTRVHPGGGGAPPLPWPSPGPNTPTK